MKPFVLVVCLLALAAIAGAQDQVAEPEPDYGRPGWYAGGGFVYAFENFGFDSLYVDELSVSGSPGVDVRGGYRFNRWVAVEGNADYYADFGFDLGDVNVSDALGFSFFANAKGYPLDGRIQPYALFGIGVLALQLYDDDGYDYDYEESDASFAIRGGAGVDFYITPKFLLNLDVTYVHATSDMHFGGAPGIHTDIIPLVFTGQYRF